MTTLRDLFPEPVGELFVQSGDLLLAIVRSEGTLIEWNRALEIIAKNLKPGDEIFELLVESSAVRFRNFLKYVREKESDTAVTFHFTPGSYALPSSFSCRLIPLNDEELLLYGQPVPELDQKEAEEYLLLTNELAATTRELERATYSLEQRTKELEAANNELKTEARARLVAEIRAVKRTEELEAIFKALPDSYFRLDYSGNILDRRGGDRNSGQPEATGHTNILDLLPDNCRNTFQDAIQQVSAAKSRENLEYAVTLNGYERYFEARILTLDDDELIAVIRDITDRKESEEALKQSEERFRQIAENIRDVFMLIEPGPPERVVYVSPAYERVWGRPREELLEHADGWLSAVAEDHRDRVSLAYEQLVAGSGTFDIEYMITRPDGKYRWIRDQRFAVHSRTGRIARIAGLAQDVTQRKIDQQKQEELVEEIKRFAYIVSHDLRAPLSNLRGFAREIGLAVETVTPAIQEGLAHLSDPERREVVQALEDDLPVSLDFISSSVSRMDRLISGILKLSRLGRNELFPEMLDMSQLVADTLSSYAHQINERGIDVVVESVPDVQADRTAMEQIMSNLIGNAINYLDPERQGKLRIGGSEQTGQVMYFVEDNGIGIEKDHLLQIFDMFCRIGTRKDVEGEGMGLAYVKTLVRRHGGQIWCDSEPGTGSTFSFTISDDSTSEAGRPGIRDRASV
jgi:PAS domain S-box-containing protein